jgi:hypothetical protein
MTAASRSRGIGHSMAFKCTNTGKCLAQKIFFCFYIAQLLVSFHLSRYRALKDPKDLAIAEENRAQVLLFSPHFSLFDIGFSMIRYPLPSLIIGCGGVKGTMKSLKPFCSFFESRARRCFGTLMLPLTTQPSTVLTLVRRGSVLFDQSERERAFSNFFSR